MIRLLRDIRGVTVVEFGLIAPVLLISVLGILDLSHTMYTASMLQGSIQKAARDSSLESGVTNETTLDQRVRDAVQEVAPGSTVSFARKSYTSYTNVGRPEDYSDVNGNNRCDAGDPYEDANGNGAYDLDRGKTGFGGARDMVAYTVTVDYPRLFPIAPFIGGSGTASLTETTILQNQPFATTTIVAPQIRACP